MLDYSDSSWGEELSSHNQPAPPILGAQIELDQCEDDTSTLPNELLEVYSSRSVPSWLGGVSDLLSYNMACFQPSV